MKVLTLNVWGGIVFDSLMDFLHEHAPNTDIFCFQEVTFGDNKEYTKVHKARENLYAELCEVLSDFTPYAYTSPSKHFASEDVDFAVGQAIFVRNNLSVIDSSGFRCYDALPVESDRGGAVTGSLQWVDVAVDDGVVTIANLHGLWQRDKGKDDTPERIMQSEKIQNFFDDKKTEKILCGDFNLSPTTKSIAMLEQGMQNLIKEYGIVSTRSSYYVKENRMADYIFTSANISVKDFKVLPDEVSDHLALLIEID